MTQLLTFGFQSMIQICYTVRFEFIHVKIGKNLSKVGVQFFLT